MAVNEQNVRGSATPAPAASSPLPSSTQYWNIPSPTDQPEQSVSPDVAKTGALNGQDSPNIIAPSKTPDAKPTDQSLPGVELPSDDGSLSAAAAVPPTVSAVSTIEGHEVRMGSSPDTITVDGTPVVRGATPTNIVGTPVALQSNGDLVLGSSTIPGFATSLGSGYTQPVIKANIITIASQGITILPSGVAISGITLTNGGPATTIAGTPISIGSDGLVMGSSTIPFPNITPTPSAMVNNKATKLLPNGDAVIDGTTLTPDSLAVTIDGTRVSLGSSTLFVGSSVIPIAPFITDGVSTAMGWMGVPNPDGNSRTNSVVIGPTSGPLQQWPKGRITIGGHEVPITEISEGVVINGVTLSIGRAATTVSGTLLSIDGSQLIIGSSTIPYTVDPTPQGGVGASISVGLNGKLSTPTATARGGSGMNGKNTTNIAGAEPFLGSGIRCKRANSILIVAILSIFTALSSGNIDMT